MAPLTLIKKYEDLIRCAQQPLSSYDKLNSNDLEDVISKRWPFIIESITCTPTSLERNTSTTTVPSFINDVHTKLDRRLKIQYQLYSDVAKRYQQEFPNRRPIKRNRDDKNTSMTDNESLSTGTTSIFSHANSLDMNIPDFYVFCPPEDSNEQCSSFTSVKQHQIDFDCVKRYLTITTDTSPYQQLVLKQTLKECCRCGNYNLLQNLCSLANLAIEDIYFDNNDTILHESIKLNNKELTSELIRHKFNIDTDGELGTPLVTSIHYNILWAVEMLLKNGADLTKRHIDWPFYTLYEYCTEFNKIDIKLIIDKHIRNLFVKHDYITIRKLAKDGWNIYLKRKQHMLNDIKIK